MVVYVLCLAKVACCRCHGGFIQITFSEFSNELPQKYQQVQVPLVIDFEVVIQRHSILC